MHFWLGTHSAWRHGQHGPESINPCLEPGRCKLLAVPVAHDKLLHSTETSTLLSLLLTSLDRATALLCTGTDPLDLHLEHPRLVMVGSKAAVGRHGSCVAALSDDRAHEMTWLLRSEPAKGCVTTAEAVARCTMLMFCCQHAVFKACACSSTFDKFQPQHAQVLSSLNCLCCGHCQCLDHLG